MLWWRATRVRWWLTTVWLSTATEAMLPTRASRATTTKNGVTPERSYNMIDSFLLL
jgi:hypothetical protein